MDSVSEQFTNGSLIVCPRKPNLSLLHFYLAIWFWCILGSHLDERSSLGLEASFSSHTYYINPVMYNDYLCSVPQLVLSVSPFSLLLLLLSIFPSIRVFSSESVLCIRCPKYWSFNFSISPSNEYSGLISFRMDWLDLLTVQGTLKSLLQHHSSKTSIHRHSAL